MEHLIILGGGSASFAAAIEANRLGAAITMINNHLPIGGTCVNVGCIPSKALIRAASILYKANHNPFAGIKSQAKLKNFKALIDQTHNLVKSLRQAKYIDIIKTLSHFRLIKGMGRIVSPVSVEINGEIIEGTKILIATGVHPFIPNIPGFDTTPYLTNQELFKLETLPESLLIIGGGYIALECAQMFARFGSKVTILQHNKRILPNESVNVTDILHKYLEQEDIRIITDAEPIKIEKYEDGIIIDVKISNHISSFKAQKLLIAAGRHANSTTLGCENIGIKTDAKGFIHVDESMQTTTSNIYAAGDVTGAPMFVYTASNEGKIAAKNALLGTQEKIDETLVPWIVFTDPQVAGIGLDEKQALKLGINAQSVSLPLSEVPRAIVARDTRGFIQLIRNKMTDRLIGARILAPEGSELLMEVMICMQKGLTIESIKKTLHPYLTLSESIRMAAIAFDKPINELSCCAV